MIDERINAQWQQVAIQLLHEVAAKVNTPAMMGTDDETGVILMFCNARHSEGKATVISTLTDRDELKKILKHTLREFRRAEVVEPTREQ
jgi:hypothetical protein